MSHPFAAAPAPAGLLLLLVAPLALLPAPLRAEGSGDRPASAEAAVVTEATLLASERFWPYRVTLTAPWQPPGREKPLPAGTLGVLIRVEDPGVARIDFSADGKYEVPIKRTDLVSNANRIRLGELKKAAPNFTWAISTRLLDPASEDSEKPVGLSPEAVAHYRGFLCVFVDPARGDFEAIAAGLAPLAGHPDVLTILFPVGHHPDGRMLERLRALGWTVPFVWDHLAEPYTVSLVRKGTPMPALLLQTSEGRVLFQDRWREGVVPELAAAIDATFGAPDRRPDAASEDPR